MDFKPEKPAFVNNETQQIGEKIEASMGDNALPFEAKSVKVQCTKCKKYYKNVKTLGIHRDKCGTEKENKRKYPKICDSCGIVFATSQTYRNHIRSCEKVSNCILDKYGNCTIGKTLRDKNWRKHLLLKHCVDGSVIVKNFTSMAQCLAWKEEIEEKTKSYFSQDAGIKKTDKAEYIYYTCQFNLRKRKHPEVNSENGMPVKKKTRKKFDNCSTKLHNTNCRAQFKINKTASSITATFYGSHNHKPEESDLRHQRVPKTRVAQIKEMVALGVPPRSVFEHFEDPKFDMENRNKRMEINRKDLVSVKYINNVKYTLNISKLPTKNDAENVKSHVMGLSTKPYNPILFYKPQKSKVLIGNHLLDDHQDFSNLFVLATQSEEQLQAMQTFGSVILCIDSTHDTNIYKFLLVNFLVKDEFNKGYPVLHIHTNHEDTAVLVAVLIEVRKKCPALRITTTMTDDDKVTEPAFKEVFGVDGDVRHLLCKWHVDRTWKRALGPVQNCLNRTMLYQALVVLRETRCENEFLNLCSGFLNKFEILEPKFVEYISNNYFNRPQQWAMCYRNFPHGDVDENMFCESFHSIYKLQYLKNKSRTLHTCITNLEKVEKYYFHTHTCNVRTGLQPCPKHEYSKRHESGLKIEDSAVVLASNELTYVVSQRENVFCYEVRRFVEKCPIEDHCLVRCPFLSCFGLCSHLYLCSCPDRSYLCKHIHKVHSFAQRREGKNCDYDVKENKNVHSQTSSYAEDGCTENSSPQYNTLKMREGIGEDTSKLYTPHLDQHSQDLENSNNTQAKNLIQVLDQLLNNKQYSGTSMNFIQKSLVSAVTHLQSLDVLHELNPPIASAEAPEMPFQKSAPNQKLAHQKDNFYATAKKRKPNSPACKFPSSELKNEIFNDLYGRSNLLPVQLNENYFSLTSKLSSRRESFIPEPKFNNWSTPNIPVNDRLSISFNDILTLDPFASSHPEVSKLCSRGVMTAGWLNDNIIDAYFFKLLSGRTVSFMQCCVLESILYGQGSMANYLSRLDFTNLDAILFPCNFHAVTNGVTSTKGNHWTLFICSIKDRTFYYLDPKGARNHPQVFMDIVMAPFIQSLLGTWKLVYPPAKLQGPEDGMNCGVFVCHFGKEFANSLPGPRPNFEVPLDVLAFRREMMFQLCS